jgi:hypothetical protein
VTVTTEEYLELRRRIKLNELLLINMELRKSHKHLEEFTISLSPLDAAEILKGLGWTERYSSTDVSEWTKGGCDVLLPKQADWSDYLPLLNRVIKAVLDDVNAR